MVMVEKRVEIGDRPDDLGKGDRLFRNELLTEDDVILWIKFPAIRHGRAG